MGALGCPPMSLSNLYKNSTTFSAIFKDIVLKQPRNRRRKNSPSRIARQTCRFAIEGDFTDAERQLIQQWFEAGAKTE